MNEKEIKRNSQVFCTFFVLAEDAQVGWNDAVNNNYWQ